MHAAAGGKAILAYLSEDKIERYLSKVELVPFTSKMITDPGNLRSQIAEILLTFRRLRLIAGV